MLTWLRERPWARWVFGGLAVAALLVAAFSAGRFSSPLKVETREVEKIVFKDRVVEKVVTVQAAAKVETRIVYRDRIVYKDGTVRESEVERTGAVAVERTATSDVKLEQHEGQRDRTASATTALRPDWRIGVLAGGAWVKPWVPISGPLVLGVEVDRRIVGGLSAGVWFNTVGAAGGSLSVEF